MIAQIGLNIVIAGAIYSLAALGFNLIYSTARFFDLGYGAYLIVGGYTVLYFHKMLGFGIIPAVILGMVAAGMVGFLVEKIVYRKLRTRKASSTVLLVASLGVFTVAQGLFAILFSSQFQTLSRDIGSERLFSFFGGIITQTQVLILLVALSIMIVLAYTLKYTPFGKAVRAISDDEEVAQVVGINSEKLLGIVFFIGAAIGGLAGIAAGFDTGIQPMGMALLLSGVIAAIVGGVGNVYGGVLGAFMLAFAENIAAWHIGGEWKFAVAFGILIIFLIFRPQGIFPK
ncbi:hypothetical protein A3C20_02990 [Candidatus Kaiserbacteria bacterium RIFCSPHIGHO2_02_FULL_55_25]|uniref:ABC transporter permease n=1 Tax=Candidatus Kaiserbacteria bacterium RIFCSPHIGHO2_02_FULL_55_25 TaxID=1798498 RepID=A0A1F6E6X3_9BACT|nr:MAG: hypothetical protein A2764_01125 [Candidatus Kaiserbacteria bacterium RIFCSPHIGHO2_01_FULL_55_79]OGG69290.1 MAG: hypothetical protein A3C20_02990 [Candidatus Kaiserbacteria bacterium RIFCSPHIGHO2_02_FULL_55_25]OGG83638.1 MAG: hypothetical protein A3A42_00470 [Candidatus Kaiserbacteria bacterium RIFCSPLOWO2_01_FULL_55_25]